MKKANFDPFDSQILDKEEQAIEDALERGEYVESTPEEFEEIKKIMADAAENWLKLNTSKPITIRINQLDLIKLKAKAARKNIPYQTLIGVLIRQYTEDEKSITL